MLFCCSSKRASADIQFCLLVAAEEGIDEFGVGFEFLVLSCFVLGVYWMRDILLTFLFDVIFAS